MKTSIELAWDSANKKAEASPRKDGELIVFRVDEHSSKSCYGGVDNEGNLLLAIEVKALPPLIEIRSAALDFFRQERRGQHAWLMVFRLRVSALTSVFGRLCQDLIDEIEGVSSESALLAVVQRRIALWQRLFENGPQGLLADFQIKGLLAELLFLEAQVSSGAREPLEMAMAWLGPSGGDQDFVFSDQAVEVKAIAPHSEGVSISSLQQLESPVPLRLHIRTMRAAAPTEPNAETLNLAIARIEHIFVPYPQALALFRASLLEAGFVAHPHYSEVAFEPVAIEEFRIEGSFPRLTTSSIPSGITSATYVLSLQQLRSAY